MARVKRIPRKGVAQTANFVPPRSFLPSFSTSLSSDSDPERSPSPQTRRRIVLRKLAAQKRKAPEAKVVESGRSQIPETILKVVHRVSENDFVNQPLSESTPSLESFLKVLQMLTQNDCLIKQHLEPPSTQPIYALSLRLPHLVLQPTELIRQQP